MVKKNVLKDWHIMYGNEGKVALEYEGKQTLIVRKSDFDRAFGTIISADYEEVKKEFAL